MGNRLHIEFGGTNLRYEVLNDRLEVIAHDSTSLKASGVTSLADFIDATFTPGQISSVLVATPTLNPEDGTIPNSGDLHFQVRLPEDYSLNYEELNDFTALAKSADNIALLKPYNFAGAPVIFTGEKPIQFYFIGPGTGLGTAPALFNPRSGELITAASEIQHSHAAIYDQRIDLPIFRMMASMRDSVPFNDTVCPLLTFEEICRGDGLSDILNALMTLHRNDNKLTTADVIQNARDGHMPALTALSVWSKYLGVTTSNMMKAHFQPSTETEIVIVLGGGVIPRIINPDNQENLATDLKNEGLHRKFLAHYRNGLKAPQTGNPDLDAVFNSGIQRAQIVIPTCTNPGLVGLRCHAARQMSTRLNAQTGYGLIAGL